MRKTKGAVTVTKPVGPAILRASVASRARCADSTKCSRKGVCGDVLIQISSVHEALRAVARELMRNHLKHCATLAIRKDERRAEAMYDEST